MHTYTHSQVSVEGKGMQVAQGERVQNGALSAWTCTGNYTKNYGNNNEVWRAQGETLII